MYAVMRGRRGTARSESGLGEVWLWVDPACPTFSILIVNPDPRIEVEPGTIEVEFEKDDLDPTFAESGIDLQSSLRDFTDIAVQPDGKILVTPYTPNSVLGAPVMRYNADGTVDSSFGDNGLAIYPSSSYYYSMNVAFHDRGGGNYEPVIAAIRAWSTSQVEPKIFQFDEEGNAVSSAGLESSAYNTPTYWIPWDLIVDADDRPVLLVQAQGESPPPAENTNRTFVARFTGGEESTWDESFGTNGRVEVGSDWSVGIGLVDQGDRYVAGARLYDSGEMKLVGLDTDNGNLDTSFGDNGTVTSLTFGPVEFVAQTMIARSTDNHMWLHGNGLVRLDADGDPVESFGNDGYADAVISGGTIHGTQTLAVDAEGRLYVTLPRYGGSHEPLGVTRYTATGAVDTTFSVDGTGRAIFPGFEVDITAIAVQPSSDQLVLAGVLDEHDPHAAFLARFKPNGGD